MDAINMYDRCIMTAGFIQWCDAGQMSVCDLLGELANAGVSMAPLEQAAGNNAFLARTTSGKFRWFLGDGNQVDTLAEQRQVYLGGSSGLVGGWNAAQIAYAKRMAMAMAQVMADPKAIEPQVNFTEKGLPLFQLRNAKADLFHPEAPLAHAEVAAARALYMSFSANLPSVADKMYARVSKDDFGSPKWLGRLARQLTYGPGITIYPGRYKKIQPVINRLYGVDLPTAEELITLVQGTVVSKNYPTVDPSSKDTQLLADAGYDARFKSTMDVQRALQALGYDIGPRGADGVMGKRTSRALMDFQARSNLVVDGILGPKTRDALVAELVRILK